MKYNCNACKTPISPFLDLGKMPLANGYLDEDEFKTEYFYNLAAALCPKCSLFQIVECPDPDRVFNPNYPHVTGISQYMKDHFRLIAETLRNEYLLDVATNDNPLAYDLITSWSHGQDGHFGKAPVPGLSLISG